MLLSAALHLAAATLALGAPGLFAPALPPEPTDLAEVDLVLGNGAARNGDPPPGLTPPPSPLPEPPSAPDAEAVEQSPPPPPPLQPAPDPASQSSSPTTVRLGDGEAAPAAEIEDAGVIHEATAESSNFAPEYPLDAARRGEAGTVVLDIAIAPDGTVASVRIAQSSGSRSLDTAARDRIATWHFHPAMRDGRPVADHQLQAVRFTR